MSFKPSGYQLAPNELYQTPAWVTRALLRFLPLRGRVVWEPCAGDHQMADVLRAAGNRVMTSDIATYTRPHDFLCDFFEDGRGLFSKLPDRSGYDDIASNPPYGHTNRKAEQFARLALDRCAGNVAMLCTAKFDFGKGRRDLFADNPRFAGKIALTDRVNWFEGGDDNTESHAWYVWAPATGLGRAVPRMFYAGQEAA